MFGSRVLVIVTLSAARGWSWWHGSCLVSLAGVLRERPVSWADEAWADDALVVFVLVRACARESVKSALAVSTMDGGSRGLGWWRGLQQGFTADDVFILGYIVL
jgi:hypothetical protein